jgi:dethiobiotin synthetase
VSPLRVLVLGTGTGIGKTFFTRSLVSAHRGSVGLKPIESGVTHTEERAGLGADGAAIQGLGFVVPPVPYLFRDPVSPHLAARRAHQSIDPGQINEWLGRVQSSSGMGSTVLVVESAGGAFSPLDVDLFNADLITRCQFDRVVLVAPNRLGVLHDVASTILALTHRVNRQPDCVVLNDTSPQDVADLARTSNLEEIQVVLHAVAPNCRAFAVPWSIQPSPVELMNPIWELLLGGCFT